MRSGDSSVLKSFVSKPTLALTLALLSVAGNPLPAESATPPVTITTGGDPMPPLIQTPVTVVLLTLLQIV